MMIAPKKRLSGFTLIEMLVYIAICSFVLMNGAMLLEACFKSYLMIERTISGEEEGLFLLQKAELAITSTTTEPVPRSFLLESLVIQPPLILVAVLADASSTNFTTHFMIASSTFDLSLYK
jgi:hypothetical protein